ncbi:YggS family pyridoxal phosphate-dependent enzyme [Gilvimarinus xylanilyticus]|uniref:Pyridoxal phosphate homeostasis protein n=1 Tax=Gilvimarinus xylanilyticus TaxID=2944139 RepID=A0A9X2KU69_9GAMM|nr:YggS family pyridoxal phosphate-dependent enzyme [Gilvimarinus xylanilyticus]MCP8899937.1 YggS family pyridoxal phosphate-dependent enzyme [Gilvimarinus xylanilyticus]
MHKIDEKLANVTARLRRAAQSVHRNSEDITLIAVSKMQGAEKIREAYACGLRSFGENYLQEALDKQTQLSELSDIEWHFIGPIQSNKTRAIAEHFNWVHSVDRLKVARRLAEQRPEGLPALNICLQVNVDAESSKAGVSLDELPVLAAEVAALPGLNLRGLMAIPAKSDNYDTQCRAFTEVRNALQQLRTQLPDVPLDTLSMGMSGDLEAAIASGATMVRIGTDLFGARTPQTPSKDFS